MVAVRFFVVAGWSGRLWIQALPLLYALLAGPDGIYPRSLPGGSRRIDPIVFFKLQLMMFFEDIRSERLLMRHAEDRPFLAPFPAFSQPRLWLRSLLSC